MNKLFYKIHDSLPVFLIDNKPYQIIYTPGNAIKVNPLSINDWSNLFDNESDIKNDDLLQRIIGVVKKNAQNSIEKWESKKSKSFLIECLTIHTGIECKLNCVYCYSKVENTGNKFLSGFPDIKSIKSVMQFIINHRNNNKPLSVVFHGSGEPTYHWNQLVNSFNYIQQTAQENNIPIFTYIATNGILSFKQIDWLSDNFSLIGISCDGPPSIQNMHRTTGSVHIPKINEVCERIIERGGHLIVRATITNKSILYLKEITDYFINELKIKEIHFEPVYLSEPFKLKKIDADLFYRNLIVAQDAANLQNANIIYSGVRLGEQHSTYCDVLRNTIRLMPNNITNNCFCITNNDFLQQTGAINKETNEFSFDPELESLKNLALRIPTQCENCINIFHCSRACPDYCIYKTGNIKSNYPDSFRCRLHQLITVESLKRFKRDSPPMI